MEAKSQHTEVIERPSWNPVRQCTAGTHGGNRCRRNAIPGGTVCVMHGGGVASVQAAAKRRLLAMVEPILDTFDEIVESWRAVRCDKCGRPTGDPAPVIRIGQLVLDRTGFHPSLNVIQTPAPNPFANLSEDELVERLEQLLTLARARRDTHRLATLDAVIEHIPDDDANPDLDLEEF